MARRRVQPKWNWNWRTSNNAYYYSNKVEEVSLTSVSRGTDIVEAGGYLPVLLTGTNWQVVDPGRHSLNKNNLSRIRQAGDITKISFYTNAVNENSLYFQVWRLDGSTYDLVGEEDVLSRIVYNSINVITLNTPISVIEGDYTCISATRTGSTLGILLLTAASTSNSLRYFASGTRPTGNDYAWDGSSAVSYVLPLKVYMRAPTVVAIGDSIVGGATANTSFIQDAIEYEPTSQITHQLNLIDSKYVCQNMGIGSQTSTSIAARFAADVVALKPKFVIINGGVNDIAGGSITKATFLSNYTTMLDACVAADIIPVVCKILPWTNGTNGQMQTRDDWMTDLLALVGTYSTAVWVDFDVAMGKYRAGGDTSNLWDLQTTPDYNDDGVHPTILGYAKMAEVIDIEIKKKYQLA